MELDEEYYVTMANIALREEPLIAAVLAPFGVKVVALPPFCPTHEKMQVKVRATFQKAWLAREAGAIVGWTKVSHSHYITT